MNYGVRKGVRRDNPALGVRKYAEKKIDRFLSPAELARLGEALAAAAALGVENPYAVAAIRLLILTVVVLSDFRRRPVEGTAASN